MPLPALSILGAVPVKTYIKIGALVLVAGTVLTLGYRVKSLTRERNDLRVAVDTAEAANKAQQGVIAGLQLQREHDAETVRRLMGDLTRIQSSDRASRKAIAELEKKNADVRDYLARPVPPALQRVLSEESGNQAGTREGKASVKPPSTVPTSK